ncbi:unnamed protein product [Linum trigynum]|uniref:Uncharacterized protein n=2 Tax=Linum trigynum TaxID=586398 RepID=A0AAV2DUP4_9ROSI
MPLPVVRSPALATSSTGGVCFASDSKDNITGGVAWVKPSSPSTIPIPIAASVAMWLYFSGQISSSTIVGTAEMASVGPAHRPSSVRTPAAAAGEPPTFVDFAAQMVSRVASSLPNSSLTVSRDVLIGALIPS